MSGSVSVDRATYQRVTSLVRMWDAYLMTGDEELRDELENLSADWCGSEAGSRMEEPLRSDYDPERVIEEACDVVSDLLDFVVAWCKTGSPPKGGPTPAWFVQRGNNFLMSCDRDEYCDTPNGAAK